MKRKKNSVEVSQQLLSPDFDFPNDCWEFIFKYFNNEEKRYSLESLSLVSKQFLSISNRFHFFLTIYQQTLPFLPRLLQRFTNLTSLHFSSVPFLPRLLQRFTNRSNFPANGLKTFSQNIKTLTSLTCSNIYFDYSYDLFLIADCFPLLQILDLSNTRRSHLVHQSRVKLRRIYFEFPKLKLLDLSHTIVDDEELYIISKACGELLQLSMNTCLRVTEKGVNHVLENCKQLREINIAQCHRVNPSIVASMVFSRPSLRKITAPPGCILSDTEKKLFKLQGCLVC